MSKLLALLTQQKALEAQIKELEANEQEAKVLEAVKEIEAIREKFNYNESDFVDVLLTYYNVNPTPAAKPAKASGTAKPAAKKAAKYAVKIKGQEVILKESTRGLMNEELKKVVNAAGFEKYGDYLDRLMLDNKADNFKQLIEKLKGVEVQ
ncbi:TPA: hypothetical protein ACGJSO_005427 [Pseudomonas aeruginosa]|uniref:hypothetical protein n=1 Tax=Pseudomonadaceae TaxID=135621 RepID=UPI00053E308B|nr:MULTISPECIES: hypothetical protein [Pseudomonadaceae]